MRAGLIVDLHVSASVSHHGSTTTVFTVVEETGDDMENHVHWHLQPVMFWCSTGFCDFVPVDVLATALALVPAGPLSSVRFPQRPPSETPPPLFFPLSRATCNSSHGHRSSRMAARARPTPRLPASRRTCSSVGCTCWWGRCWSRCGGTPGWLRCRRRRLRGCWRPCWSSCRAFKCVFVCVC